MCFTCYTCYRCCHLLCRDLGLNALVAHAHGSDERLCLPAIGPSALSGSGLHCSVSDLCFGPSRVAIVIALRFGVAIVMPRTIGHSRGPAFSRQGLDTPHRLKPLTMPNSSSLETCRHEGFANDANPGRVMDASQHYGVRCPSSPRLGALYSFSPGAQHE